MLCRPPLQEWRSYASQVWDPAQGERLEYIYYRYFFQRISQPDSDTRPEAFSILSPRVIEMARVNGDMKPPPPPVEVNNAVPLIKTTSSSLVPSLSPQASSLKRSSEVEDNADWAKKPKTVLNRYMIPATVVDVSDDSDDDIGKTFMKFVLATNATVDSVVVVWYSMQCWADLQYFDADLDIKIDDPM